MKKTFFFSSFNNEKINFYEKIIIDVLGGREGPILTLSIITLNTMEGKKISSITHARIICMQVVFFGKNKETGTKKMWKVYEMNNSLLDKCREYNCMNLPLQSRVRD